MWVLMVSWKHSYSQQVVIALPAGGFLLTSSARVCLLCMVDRVSHNFRCIASSQVTHSWTGPCCRWHFAFNWGQLLWAASPSLVLTTWRVKNLFIQTILPRFTAWISIRLGGSYFSFELFFFLILYNSARNANDPFTGITAARLSFFISPT